MPTLPFSRAERMPICIQLPFRFIAERRSFTRRQLSPLVSNFLRRAPNVGSELGSTTKMPFGHAFSIYEYGPSGTISAIQNCSLKFDSIRKALRIRSIYAQGTARRQQDQGKQDHPGQWDLEGHQPRGPHPRRNPYPTRGRGKRCHTRTLSRVRRALAINAAEDQLEVASHLAEGQQPFWSVDFALNVDRRLV
jgi:hypothetical protein